MRAVCAILPLIFLILSTGCSSISVSHDYDTKFDFTSLERFSWLPIPISAELNQLNIRRLKDAVNAELDAKGYKKAENSADFLIAAHLIKQQKMDIRTWGYSYRPYGRYHWHGSGVEAYEYEEGTLIIDFIDAKSNEMIWRGVAKGKVGSSPTPKEQVKKISETVEKLLADFPPQ